MSAIVYKLWIDSTVLDEADGAEMANLLVQKHLYSLDSPNILHLGAFQQTENGLKPLWAVMGRDQIEQKLLEMENDSSNRPA